MTMRSHPAIIPSSQRRSRISLATSRHIQRHLGKMVYLSPPTLRTSKAASSMIRKLSGGRRGERRLDRQRSISVHSDVRRYGVVSVERSSRRKPPRPLSSRQYQAQSYQCRWMTSTMTTAQCKRSFEYLSRCESLLRDGVSLTVFGHSSTSLSVPSNLRTSSNGT